MISDETKAYYDLKKRNEVRESAKRLRKQFLRYKDAEIVYSIQHTLILTIGNLKSSSISAGKFAADSAERSSNQ